MGLTKVYTAQNPFQPLLQGILPPLTQINYVGFASAHRTQYYYFVDDETFISAPDRTEDTWAALLKIEHPLLVIPDFPIGYSELFFKRYMKVYQTSAEQRDKYVQFIQLNELQGVQPYGYLLRFPFYVQGTENAHILLSSKEHPTEQDPAYEIVIGDLSNSRIVIRKRIRGVVLGDIRRPNILSKLQKIKFVLEVSTTGEIKLYHHENPYRPLVQAFDPNPVLIKYISFKNYKNEKLDFFYGNPPRESREKIIAELLTSFKNKYTVNPLLIHWNNVQNTVTTQSLIKYSQYYEAWTKSFTNWYKVREDCKPKGFHVRLGVYLKGHSDARILLSAKENPGPNDKVYEIHLGTNQNTISRIFTKINKKEEVATSYEPHVLSPYEPIKVVIEVSVG